MMYNISFFLQTIDNHNSAWHRLQSGRDTELECHHSCQLFWIHMTDEMTLYSLLNGFFSNDNCWRKSSDNSDMSQTIPTDSRRIGEWREVETPFAGLGIFRSNCRAIAQTLEVLTFDTYRYNEKKNNNNNKKRVQSNLIWNSKNLKKWTLYLSSTQLFNWDAHSETSSEISMSFVQVYRLWYQQGVVALTSCLLPIRICIASKLYTRYM